MLFAFAPRSFDDQRSQELSYLFLPVDPPEDIIISAPGKFEEAKVEAALTQSSGQEDLSASTKTVLPPQAAQKPLASTLASGLVGESSQAALETEATTAAPTLDERLSAASAAADLTARQAERSAIDLASYRKQCPPNPVPSALRYLKAQEEHLEALVSRRDNELLALLQLRAEARPVPQSSS